MFVVLTALYGIYYSGLSSLDAADVKSYRPISNLSVLSKLERLVAKQLIDYLKSAKLFP